MNFSLVFSIIFAMTALIGLGYFIYRRFSSQKKSIQTSIIQPTQSQPSEPIKSVVLTDDQRVSKGLSRTQSFLTHALSKIFSSTKQGDEFFQAMEEALLMADIGIGFTQKILADLKKNNVTKTATPAELKTTLSQILTSHLTISKLSSIDVHPYVVMVVGVNGSGKTTTIAKLCSRFLAEGRKVLVGSADTFRVAATEQLKTWVERVGAEGVFQEEGADPSAVAFDSVQAAIGRKADVCIIDTAGRLHTKTNLMEELKKMKRVVGKAMPGAPHDIWLVIDGTMGQNALNQAREFHQNLGLTGIIVTKLDGSAKGGIVIAISSELQLPIVFIGVGEGTEDLIAFNGKQFVEAILGGEKIL